MAKKLTKAQTALVDAMRGGVRLRYDRRGLRGARITRSDTKDTVKWVTFMALLSADLIGTNDTHSLLETYHAKP